jgi:hypothetical protein
MPHRLDAILRRARSRSASPVLLETVMVRFDFFVLGGPNVHAPPCRTAVRVRLEKRDGRASEQVKMPGGPLSEWAISWGVKT